MKNISLKLFALSMLVLSNCVIVPADPNITVNPTATTSPSGTAITATPTAVPTVSTPVPTASPVIKAGRTLSYTGTTVDWGSLNAAEKARWKVQDFDNRRLVVQFDPEHLDRGGEFEFTWDKPPAEIGVDDTFTLSITGKINAVPENFVAGAINVSFSPNGFYEASPADSVSQNTGRLSHGELDQGTKQIRLKATGLKNLGYNESYKYSIYYYTGGGPTISYNYQMIKN
jgi:hypothetical protein